MLLLAVKVVLCLSFANIVHCFIDGLYCGKEDCYSVLGVPRDAPKVDIARAYRQLARKHHPDMHKSSEAKRIASERFTVIATAYEVLKDDDSRKDYDYMLDHPDEIYGHYYRYYRRQMAPKVDARIVIIVTITVISVIQYFTAWSRYKWAVDHLITVPKYRLKALEIAKQEKLLDISKKRDRRNKEQIKLEEEAVLKKILEDKIDIRGGYSKPSVMNVLWIQLICLPYIIVRYLCWNIWWIWKFSICGKPYGEAEKFYLIRRFFKCSLSEWDDISVEEKEEYLKAQIWIKGNFESWKQEKVYELKAMTAENSKYKRDRRYLKNHGPGKITFDD